MQPRVRFAPSPTGYLHVGGARTAITNYLYARKHGGRLVLRIEDTDRERSTPEAERAILEGLEWLGITCDEGPFYQSENLPHHREAALRLVEKGKAYYCFATPEELARQREALKAKKQTWRFDPRYREMDPEEAQRLKAGGKPCIIRFRVPREGDRTVRFDDIVFGPQERACREIEDFALLRADGSPLYNLSVVVDDASMGITHVIRGQDHIANTFKQILLYEALDHPLPIFGHLPLILATDKSKLSKRKHGEGVSLTTYRERGFLPEALFNFLALLGWNPGDEREIFSREELVEVFDLSRVNRSNAIFNVDLNRGEWTDRKALWMNAHYISHLPLEKILPRVEEVLKKADMWSEEYGGAKREWFVETVDLLRQRYHLLTDFADLGKPYFSDDYPMEEKGYAKRVLKVKDQLVDLLPSLIERLEGLEAFDPVPTEERIRAFCEEKGVKPGLIINALRLLSTGQSAGPGIFDILRVIGKERVIARLKRGLERLNG